MTSCIKFTYFIYLFLIETSIAAKTTALTSLPLCIVKKDKDFLLSEPTCWVMCNRYAHFRGVV